MYILEIGELQKGDVFLTSERSLTSKTVRAGTLSDYSHAMLYVGDSSYIHSDADGVHAGNVQRLLFEEPARVKVLRPKQPSLAEIASRYARAEIGKAYSVKEALRTKVGTKKKKENKQFCSRLVAEAYEAAGQRITKSPSYCSPDDLNRSSFFDEVPGIVREASEKEVAFAKSHNPLEEQDRATNKILSEARRITQRDIQTLTQLTEFLIKNPKHSDSIVEVYRSTGYLLMWKEEMESHPWRYDGKLFMSLEMPREEKLEAAESELASARELLARYSEAYLQLVQLDKAAPSSYITMNLELYKNLIEQMRKREAAAEYVLNNV